MATETLGEGVFGIRNSGDAHAFMEARRTMEKSGDRDGFSEVDGGLTVSFCSYSVSQSEVQRTEIVETRPVSMGVGRRFYNYLRSLGIGSK